MRLRATLRQLVEDENPIQVNLAQCYDKWLDDKRANRDRRTDAQFTEFMLSLGYDNEEVAEFFYDRRLKATAGKIWGKQAAK